MAGGAAGLVLSVGGSRVPGPWGIVGAILARYYLRVQPTYISHLTQRVTISNKVFTYAAAAHLLVSTGPAAWPTFLGGALFGLLYHSKVLPLHLINGLPAWLVPDEGIIAKPGPGLVAGPVGAGRPDGRAAPPPSPEAAPGRFNVPEGAPAEAHVPAPIVADPEAVNTLLAMGFERPAVEAALRDTHNNLELATAVLLGDN